MTLRHPLPTDYDTDYCQWVEETLQNLRDRQFDRVDWEQLLEEIADLSRRERDKLISLTTRLFEHLLKLTCWESKRSDNYRHWLGEIRNFRLQIKRLLKNSPSLKPFLAENLENCYQDARRIVMDRTGMDATQLPTQAIANSEQLLDEDWLPKVEC
jgi:hypothetical protein